jgi:hypothetical protein
LEIKWALFSKSYNCYFYSNLYVSKYLGHLDNAVLRESTSTEAKLKPIDAGAGSKQSYIEAGIICLFLVIILSTGIPKPFLEHFLNIEYASQYTVHSDNTVLPESTYVKTAGSFIAALSSASSSSAGKIFAATAGVTACEVTTSAFSQYLMFQRGEVITERHQFIHGADPSKWLPEARKSFDQDHKANDATHSGGAIEKIIRSEHTQELAKTAAHTVEKVSESVGGWFPWSRR